MNGRTGIMAQAQLDSDHCNSDLIGTGPFVLEDWKANDRFRAIKNIHYWQKDPRGIPLPYLDQIEFRPLENNASRYQSLRSSDLTMIHTTDGGAIKDIRQKAASEMLNNVESDAYAEVDHLMLNVSKPPFDSPTARMALAYAVDREQLTQLIGRGTKNVASGPFAPGNIGYLESSGFPEFDLERARELVREYEKESGQPFRFVYTNPSDSERETGEVIQQLGQEAGIEVELRPIGDQSQFINSIIGGDYQAASFRNYPGGDPDLQYVWWYGTGGDEKETPNPVNFGRFNDPEINRLLDEGRQENRSAKRRAIYEDLNRVFAEKIYAIWAWWTLWSIASAPNVHGVYGPPLPDGGGEPAPDLATGHPVLGLWVEH